MNRKSIEQISRKKNISVHIKQLDVASEWFTEKTSAPSISASLSTPDPCTPTKTSKYVKTTQQLKIKACSLLKTSDTQCASTTLKYKDCKTKTDGNTFSYGVI